jgi:membrane protein
MDDTRPTQPQAMTREVPAPVVAPLPAAANSKARGDIADPGVLAANPDSERLGRLAHRPTQIPWSGWKRVLRRTAREMATDRISLVAAGCAFYATLALFPAITMLVSIYGLAFDPATVGPQLAVLRDLLPPSAYQLIADRVQVLVSKPPSTLTFSLAISIAIALWSSSTGTKSILGALNLAYEERETRSFLRFQLTAMGMTLGGILAAVIGLAALLLLPAAVALLHISAYGALIAKTASFALLVLFVLLALSLLYRFGPSRRSAGWHWVTPGSLFATVLWLIVSALFSFYVQHLASYDATYGPLGAVVGVMMWFYVSALVVMIGAELNAELELQTVRDSTDGPEKPIGERGAYVADHVAR